MSAVPGAVKDRGTRTWSRAIVTNQAGKTAGSPAYLLEGDPGATRLDPCQYRELFHSAGNPTRVAPLIRDAGKLPSRPCLCQGFLREF